MQMEWSDGKKRCCWANPKNERYIRYHDEEWGVPVYDDGKLFEMLVLECFQAGLSWECVLNKWEAFREAFDGFDLETVCAYGKDKLEALKNDPGIIRNRLKIQAAVTNARVFREIQGGIWQFLRVSLALDCRKSGLRKWADTFGAFGQHLKGSKETGHEVRWDDGDLRIFAGSRRDLFSRWGLLFGTQDGGIERR